MLMSQLSGSYQLTINQPSINPDSTLACE